MKALITSGGKGTRLRPITHTSNKHLIPIANKPMIHFAIEAVLEAGIKDAGIVYNPDTGDEIKKALGDGSQWGMSFTYILQEAPLGLAHVVKVSQDFLGDEPFVFYLGDNVVVGGIKRFIDDFKQNGSNCHLVLSRVQDPERFGVPEIRDGKIVRVEEKPSNPKSQYAVTGIYIYDSTIFEAVNNIKPSARGELEISDAHDYLINHGYKVGYSEITGWWKDTGKPEDLLEANRLTLDRIIGNHDSIVNGKIDDASDIAGKVIIENGAQIIRSSIRGPVIIGENTVIEDSYIGPFTSIYYGCQIKNSEVEYSIILEKCKIIDADTRIERSLLGREAEIIKCRTKPKTQKFIIGDQSIVELI
ncbi:MAG: glucose-1-phosphate thymidylyltransferase [Nitrospirae bacterium]|nr:glucose-1-phosphate thymidylyltransferase [Nitrospirota bacterium]